MSPKQNNERAGGSDAHDTRQGQQVGYVSNENRLEREETIPSRPTHKILRINNV